MRLRTDPAECSLGAEKRSLLKGGLYFVMSDYGRSPEIKSELTFQRVRKLFDTMMPLKGVNHSCTNLQPLIGGQFFTRRPRFNAIRCIQLCPLKRIRI